MTDNRPGPNVKRLIHLAMAQDAIPDNGGIADGLNFLQNAERISAAAISAAKWVSDAIDAVRNADDPNRFREASDEEIAKEILNEIERQAR